MKKIIVFTTALFAMGALFAQQRITNFGVVDTAKVYERFFRNSSAVKNYEKKREDIQKELDKRADEIRDLQAKLQEAKTLENNSEIKKYEDMIRNKANSLKAYKQSKDTELNNAKKSLEKNDDFYKELNRTIKKVAENEGLSMVLNLQQNNGILWYSTSVDITEKVIKALEM